MSDFGLGFQWGSEIASPKKKNFIFNFYVNFVGIDKSVHPGVLSALIFATTGLVKADTMFGT